MKKLHLILLTVFLNMVLFSCNPQTISDMGVAADEEEECCGNTGDIPPPPPPGSGG